MNETINMNKAWEKQIKKSLKKDEYGLYKSAENYNECVKSIKKNRRQTMNEKIRKVITVILIIITSLIFIYVIGSMYTDRPDFATSPDEAIRTK